MDPFLPKFRRMPTANAEGSIESESSIGKLLGETRVFRHPSDRPRVPAFAVGMRRDSKRNALGVATTWSAIETAVDLMFWVDLGLNFLTGIDESPLHVIYDIKIVARSYLEM